MAHTKKGRKVALVAGLALVALSVARIKVLEERGFDTSMLIPHAEVVPKAGL